MPPVRKQCAWCKQEDIQSMLKLVIVIVKDCLLARCKFVSIANLNVHIVWYASVAHLECFEVRTIR